LTSKITSRSSLTSTDSISIRDLVPNDIAACARLVDDSPLLARYGFSGEAAAEQLAVAMGESGKTMPPGRADLFAAFARGSVDDGPLGFVWFYERGAFARSGYLKLLLVSQAAQGRGIGRLLMGEMERRHLVPRGIVLLCSRDNTGAKRFYERLGYHQVGALPGYTLQGLDEHIYYKPAVR
jgi:ribosomal protein S18 acetylase RimI-like enzyme